ncbi:protocadherin delta 1 [Paragonimus westermani]|uniref:Protocadherin delta 1 n=1 Tax=Paragonimus westermani TaxID=34504 RepID=A0A5J4NZK2_9TREM|nr:protocadherin delta 1 [Paragonimus westermani]
MKYSIQKQLTYSINEESEVGTFIGNLKLDAERKFLIPYNQLKEFELYDDYKQGLFRVEQDSGKLFVASRIDRETLCPQPEASTENIVSANEHPWTVVSLSREQKQMVSSKTCEIHLALSVAQEYWMNVIININDINDHQPFFPIVASDNQTPVYYVVNISESVPVGYELPLIAAKDADSDSNSVQSYSLRGAELDPNIFSISYQPPFTLNLNVLADLDAEKKSNYTGELVACDGGNPIPKCGVQPFQIQITDLNDNKPIFDKSLYEVEVNETVMNRTTILTVKATDADSGPRGRIRYRFGQPITHSVLTHFTVNPVTGEVYTKKSLNAKEQSRYVIPILAQDSGVVPLIGQAVVRINVIDVNDHAPWVEVRPVQNRVDNSNKSELLSVEENQPVGTSVGLFIVGDEDTGENSVVECHLKDTGQQFYLEHANSAKGREIYRLSTNRSFDREMLSDGVIYITIGCTDKGSPKRTTEKNLPITVLDVNEFRPEFLAEKRLYTVVLEEEGDPGTFVLQVQATDLDATPNIRYYLSREAQSFFHVDPHTGIITTRVVLDREETPKIRFTVYATDKDVPVDREVTTTMANITVLLTDVNDNAPELTENRVLQIVENRPGFSDLVGQLTSVDKDYGINGTVRYKLLSVSSGGRVLQNDSFMINKDSGKLFTLQSLDREQHRQYLLHVLLYDIGLPHSRNTTEAIVVDVLDENDNNPVWGSLVPLVPNAEYIPNQQATKHSSRLLGVNKLHELGLLNITAPLYRGQRVCKLMATDPDAPHNANLTYHVIAVYFTPFAEEVQGAYGNSQPDMASSVLNYFTVTAFVGELTVGPGARGTGLMKAGLAEVYLRVSDNGNPPFDTTARLFIQISAPFSNVLGMESSSKGLLSYILSSGHLGIAMTVLLVFIMCLTSICLLLAFLSMRRRSNKLCCDCCYYANRKPVQSLPDISQLQLNSQVTAEDGLILDGQLSALGKFYHTPKANSVLSDGGSLYRWNVESNSYTMGHFGPPPIYNFSAINATLDRMHNSHTGSDKSGIALLPFDAQCQGGSSMFDERPLNSDQIPHSPIGNTCPATKSDCQQTRTSEAHERKRCQVAQNFRANPGSVDIKLPLEDIEIWFILRWSKPRTRLKLRIEAR